MNIDAETTGKILGMLMAYFASFLGLLLAWYNYKKRGAGSKESSKESTQKGNQ